MLTVEQFETIEVGDQIEAGNVFKRLNDEPIVLLAAAVRSDAIEFVVTYIGITLGRWVCYRKKDRLEWLTS